MLSRKTKHLLLKIISMFSVVRGYNIPVIVLAQYLSSIFILAPEKRALEVILDKNLFLIVLLSSLTIASGYIINNFCSIVVARVRPRSKNAGYSFFRSTKRSGCCQQIVPHFNVGIPKMFFKNSANQLPVLIGRAACTVVVNFFRRKLYLGEQYLSYFLLKLINVLVIRIKSNGLGLFCFSRTVNESPICFRSSAIGN